MNIDRSLTLEYVFRTARPILLLLRSNDFSRVHEILDFMLDNGLISEEEYDRLNLKIAELIERDEYDKIFQFTRDLEGKIIDRDSEG